MKHKVIVIGGNFAGISAAKVLSSTDIELCLIDPGASFSWTPNVHEILSGTKRQSDLELSRKALMASFGGTFLQREVVVLDPAEKNLRLNDGSVLDFDACLIACGYQTNQIANDSIGFRFRNAGDVGSIVTAIEQFYAQNNKVNISIVGGGFSGVEALGELLRHLKKTRNVNIRMIESSERLVKDLPSVVSDDVLHLCTSKPVEFLFNRRVVNSKPGQLTLSDGSVQDSDVTIWTTGGTLPSFIRDSGLNSSGDTGIPFNSMLQSQVNPCVFIAGDAAHILAKDSKVLPKQSYHALDSGATAATNLVNWLNGEKPEVFIPKPRPVLLSFGDLNTYMVMGESVIASPLLAASKEAIYQLNLYKLSAPLPLTVRKSGAFRRLIRSTNRLLLPELRLLTPLKIIQRSRILKYGSVSDMKLLKQGIQGLLFE